MKSIEILDCKIGWWIFGECRYNFFMWRDNFNFLQFIAGVSILIGLLDTFRHEFRVDSEGFEQEAGKVEILLILHLC